MPTLLSVGNVVRFDVAFVEQMLTKLAVRRPAAPSFCLIVGAPAGTSTGAARGEQAVFADLSAGAVERASREAAIVLKVSAPDLENALQGRITYEDFVRRVELEVTPPSALTAFIAALRPEAAAASPQARDLGGEAEERRYASVGGDGMLDEQGRRVKGKPQAFTVKVSSVPAFSRAVVTGPARKAGDSHDFGRDNLLHVLQPIARFASEQQASSFRVQTGMASVKQNDSWSELGRLGDY